MLYLFLALKTLIKAGLGVTVSIVSMNHTMYTVTPKLNESHYNLITMFLTA